jgi:hypothetical protein
MILCGPAIIHSPRCPVSVPGPHARQRTHAGNRRLSLLSNRLRAGNCRACLHRSAHGLKEVSS